MGDFRILQTESYGEMSRCAANLISAQITVKPTSVIGLATGSTPLGIYAQLCDRYKKGDLDFSQVRTTNLDEYVGLGRGDGQSYAEYMERNLFSQVNIARENTHIPNGKAEDLHAECEKYDRITEEHGGMDLQLLGMGLDGHIGFNEPQDRFESRTHIVKLDSSTIAANSRFFSSAEEVPHTAITLGMKSIMQARKILLAVSGEAKSEMLKKALYGPVTPRVPASILQLHPDVTVVVSRR